jgi:hypothetical protein
VEMTAARVEIPAHRTIATRVRHGAASSTGGPQIPGGCCGGPAATDSTPVNTPILLLPYARRWVCRYCVYGVDRAASPVAGKGLTLSHGWRTVWCKPPS